MKPTNNGLLLLLLLIMMSCNPESTQQNDTHSPPPNIVFLFTDDQTFRTINALGNEFIQTPNLDRLVNSGTTFTHAYNMGGWHGAVCVASRSMIISGQSIWKAREREKKWEVGDSASIAQTWGRLMARNGYDTYLSGKWHIRAPSDQVFDQVLHERPGMPPDAWGKGGGGRKVVEAKKNGTDIAAAMPIGYNRPLSPSDNTWSPVDSSQGGFWEGGTHWSEVVKLDALSFIETASQKENPFFMYLAFNAPHDPRQAPQPYQDLYSVDAMTVPPNFLPEYPWKDEIGNGQTLRDEALAPYPRTPYAVKKHLQEYYAIISHLDAQIGNILDALEGSGKMDNTYIFFTADHGLSVGQHGLIGKQSLFDHSIRVPLMVMGPDVPAGKKLDHDVYLQDIMPTSLELARIEKPDYVFFNSLWDMIIGTKTEGYYPEVYGCYRNLQRMIRKDGYKLLVYPEADQLLLFDLGSDPYEIKDLSTNSAQRERLKTLFQDLLKLQESMQDPLDLKPFYKKHFGESAI